MTSPSNSNPAHIWEVLQRLLNCNKAQLAERLGVNARTLRRWTLETEAGESAGKAANEAAAQLLQATLSAANNSDIHAQWRLNWDAIRTIGGRK